MQPILLINLLLKRLKKPFITFILTNRIHFISAQHIFSWNNNMYVRLTINHLPGALIFNCLDFRNVSFSIKVKLIITVSRHQVFFEILRNIMQRFVAHFIFFKRHSES
ncbi:hypothetical protein AFL22_19695 [Pantoea sp. CFSAN033090]|nr:hypothetical protein AFL22_19695 [Pantoea sp. CFSAN033090]